MPADDPRKAGLSRARPRSRPLHRGRAGACRSGSARERAQKFTPIRRQVLQALLSSHRPLGAYEVIDELAKSMPRPAPITVYRALDFLMDERPRAPHRKPQRLSRLRAHDHDAAALVAFLICERCGSGRRDPGGVRSRKASTPRRAPPASRPNCPWSKSPAPARIARKPLKATNGAKPVLGKTCPHHKPYHPPGVRSAPAPSR